MPFFPDPDDRSLQVPLGREPVYAPTPPGGLGAAFRLENPIASVIASAHGYFPPDDTHRPLDLIRDTPYFLNHRDRFIGSRSEAETRHIMGEIDREEHDRAGLEANGIFGVLMSMGAGFMDPTILLPAGSVVRSVRGGVSVARSAGSGAAAVGAQVAGQEAVLQASQQTRPAEESAIAIGTATLLGGLIGGGAAGLLSRGERRVMTEALERERQIAAAHVASGDNVVPFPAPVRRAGEVTIPESARSILSQHSERMTARQYFSDPTERERAAIVLPDGSIHEFSDAYGREGEWAGRGAHARFSAEAGSDFPYAVITGYGDKSLSIMSQVELTPQQKRTVAAFQGEAKRRPGLDLILDLPESPVRPAGEVSGEGVAPTPASGSSLAASVGAAAADTRKMEPVGFLLNKIPGWSRVAHLLGTDLGVYSTGSEVGKRLASELWDTTLRFKQNVPRTYKDPVSGEVREIPAEVTSPVVPLDTEVLLTMEQMQVRAQDTLKGLYSDYYFGEQVSAPYARAEAQNLLGRMEEGKLTPAQFEHEIVAAMNSGDTHAIPQVAQAAQFIRKEIIDPYAKRMAGANPDFTIKQFPEGRSFFPYRWLREAIIDRPVEWVDDMLPHFIADQEAKAAAKGRMIDMEGQLTDLEKRLAKASEDEAAQIQARIDDTFARIEEEIANWHGKTVAEARSDIKAREKYRAEREAEGKTPGAEGRLTQADSAIRSAVRRIIESDRDLSIPELRQKIEEIRTHITATPAGRVPYDIATTANATRSARSQELRGSLLARDFDIPYPIAAKWLDHRLDNVLGSWMRTMVPDTLLWERFPGEGPAMTSRIRQIQEEYDAKLRAVEESKKSEKAKQKESKRLNDERNRVIETISAVVDRVRHMTNNTTGMAGRVGESIRRGNQMIDLGFAAWTSIADFGGPILFHGLSRVFGDGWGPLLRYVQEPERVKWSRTELRDSAIATEMATATRGHALAETTDAYMPHTTGERALKAVSDKFFMANMQAPETQAAKEIAGSIASAAILRAIAAEQIGKATKKQITQLRESNISADLSRRIWKEFNRPDGGKDFEGTRLPNTALWQDERARMHFLAALRSDVNRAVVTPGQEKPIWLSSNVGSLLGQYQGFTMAATNKILISNLQRRDAQTLQGILGMVALGMLSYKLTAMLRGRDTSKDRPQDILKEGINRSGLTGAFETLNMFSSKATRGSVDMYRLIGADKPLSRSMNQTILSSLLGPTARRIETITRIGGAIGAGEWTQNDTHAWRQLILGQNLFWFHGVLDQVERGFNSAFGIPMKQ